MARLLSVNVGLARDIEWKGRTVHTGIWKDPVQWPLSGRQVESGWRRARRSRRARGRAARRLRLPDRVVSLLAGAVERTRLRRTDSSARTSRSRDCRTTPCASATAIGSAARCSRSPSLASTCYRVGIRMNEPRMPALLTSSGRPGFYFRVLQEGEVGAGDEIVKVGEAKERMTVAEVNALLYLLRSSARTSSSARCASRHFRPAGVVVRGAAAEPDDTGATRKRWSHAGNGRADPARRDFGRSRWRAIDRESVDVISLTLQSPDGRRLDHAPAWTVRRPASALDCRRSVAFPQLFALGSALDEVLSDQREDRAERGRQGPYLGTMSGQATCSTSARHAEASSCSPVSGRWCC